MCCSAMPVIGLEQELLVYVFSIKSSQPKHAEDIC